MYIRHLAALFFLAIPVWLVGASAWLVGASACDKKNAKPAEYNWDLSKSNDISVVDWPADMCDKNGIASLGGPAKVSLRLGICKTISATVEEIQAEKRGNKIRWIALLYPNMPLKDSVATSKEIVSVLNYKCTAIEDWFKKRKSEFGPGFEEIHRGKQHELTIKILHSYDTSQPWWVMAKVYFE